MKNTIYASGLIVLAFTVLASALFVVWNPWVVKATILAFSPATCYTASATSTLRYLAWGAGTTTVTCNMSPDGAEEAVIAFQLTASSTGTDLRFAVEESMDGQDWYPVLATGQELGTTSPEVNLALKGTYAYKFSSSSALQGGVAFAGQATSTGAFSVPVRMKQIRAYAYLASTSGHLTNKNGAIWFQILPRQATD